MRKPHSKIRKSKKGFEKGTKAINTMLPVVFDVLKNKGIDINLKKNNRNNRKTDVHKREYSNF